MPTVKEVYTDIAGNTTVEYDDNSTSKFNQADQLGLTTGGITIGGAAPTPAQRASVRAGIGIPAELDVFKSDTELVSTQPCNALISVNAARTTLDKHAFEDWCALNVTAGAALGYASFDAKPTMNNSVAQDHLVGFQARPTYNGSAGLSSRLSGMDVALDHTGTGVVEVARGIHVANPTGAGPITVNYGLYIDALTRGTTNFGVYCLSGYNHFAGKVSVGVVSTLATYKLDVKGADSDGVRYSGSTSDSVMGSEAYGGYVGTTNDTDFSVVRNGVRSVKISTAGATISGGFGANDAAPQPKYTVNAACSDLATVVALANQLRAALIANGICV